MNAQNAVKLWHDCPGHTVVRESGPPCPSNASKPGTESGRRAEHRLLSTYVMMCQAERIAFDSVS